MYKVKVNDQYSFEIETDNGLVQVDSENVEVDVAARPSGRSHILYKNKSYNVEIIAHDSVEKQVSLKVNGQPYTVMVEDQYDQLLKQLGLDNLQTNKAREVKAPMPGMVLQVLVAVGQEVKKGDNLLVLEAMKMENIIKSSSDGLVKTVLVQQGDKVEKNAILLQFA